MGTVATLTLFFLPLTFVCVGSTRHCARIIRYLAPRLTPRLFPGCLQHGYIFQSPGRSGVRPDQLEIGWSVVDIPSGCRSADASGCCFMVYLASIQTSAQAVA